MAIDRYIKEVVSATERKRVEGKKRLQKLIYLLDESGYSSGAKFFLKDYGPFSRDIESVSEFMSLFGELVELPVEIGYSNYMATAYELPEGEVVFSDKNFSNLVKILDHYRTVDLEIASTIRYFQREGSSLEGAIRKTREMKPSKTTEKVIARAKEILSRIPDSDGAKTYTRSHS